MFKKFFHLLFPRATRGQFVTVRYAFPLVIVATIFASLASVVTNNESYVTIKTNVETVTRDQEFFIEVLTTTHVAVNAVDLTISYPEDKVSVLGIDTGTSVITLWAEEPYASGGKIYLRGGTFRKGFIGEHPIARIRVKANESGSARVFVSDSQLVAGDGKGSSVQVSDSSKNEVRIAILGENGKITGEATLAIITDTNGDGKVDLSDVSAFMAAWFTRGKTFDFNGDGHMTFIDFSILLADSFLK